MLKKKKNEQLHLDTQVCVGEGSVPCAFRTYYKVFSSWCTLCVAFLYLVSALARILLSDTWETHTLPWLRLAHHVSLDV